MQKLTQFYYVKKIIGSKNPFEFARNISGLVTFNYNSLLTGIQSIFKGNKK